MEALESNNQNKGILYLVSTPIGNYADITLRALRILKECDIIVCEEFKEAKKLLKFFEIEKELLQLNEHNEKEITEEIIGLLESGKNISLISDCGTPAFADPGNYLLNECINRNIKVDCIPGANSVLAALVISGFDISRFFYLGFLSQKNDERNKQLKDIGKLNRTAVIMETPYRLNTFLKSIEEILPEKKLFIGFNLTMESERQFRGTASEILNQISTEYSEGKIKGEFVIIIDN